MKVGGKCLNLGELVQIDGVNVPDGFCITTDAYRKIIGDNRELQPLLLQLRELKVDDMEKIRILCSKIRKVIEEMEIDGGIAKEINLCLASADEDIAYAVRSSATSEDLQWTSFAGQYDTYLNIKGKHEVLKSIKKCFSSLFTDRAVIYRKQNGFESQKLYMAVIIQQMIPAEASGVIFTSDPISSNRNILVVNASYGLGETIVSGLVNADLYKVRDGKIITKVLAEKSIAIYASKNGGTEQQEIAADMKSVQTLTDSMIIQLERIGRMIEANFSHPQDIEWCLYKGRFYILQTRKITTLYPIPEVQDSSYHIFMSVGHAQMMTDAFKPLGMSFFEYFTNNQLWKAGGRFYLDITNNLKSPIKRKLLLSFTNVIDNLSKSALESLLKQEGFLKKLPKVNRTFVVGKGISAWIVPASKLYISNNFDVIKKRLDYFDTLLKDLERRINNIKGDKLFEFILQDQKQAKDMVYDPTIYAAVVGIPELMERINKKVEKWLGEKDVAYILSQSVRNNVVSDMGLALLDLSDIVRKYPEVVEYLNHAKDKSFFDDIIELEGGYDVNTAIRKFLEKYGMRCPGEIDITKPRWNEKPTSLIPIILSNIRNLPPQSHTILFEQGLKEATEKKQEILARIEQLSGGKRKKKALNHMIDVLRNFMGCREYPKYFYARRIQIYKQALLREADDLIRYEILQKKEDVFYLSFEELRRVVHTRQLDYSIITKRKEEYSLYEQLTPPRIITSEGEIIQGIYSMCNTPQGALVGMPISPGIVEGNARIILNMEDADIANDDILVTYYTDPSWTPLFLLVKAVVTEVGGMMTHGAVIAREYGVPGVVGVENATHLIKNGDRIRVNGTEGYVEILSSQELS